MEYREAEIPTKYGIVTKALPVTYDLMQDPDWLKAGASGIPGVPTWKARKLSRQDFIRWARSQPEDLRDWYLGFDDEEKPIPAPPCAPVRHQKTNETLSNGASAASIYGLVSVAAAILVLAMPIGGALLGAQLDEMSGGWARRSGSGYAVMFGLIGLVTGAVTGGGAMAAVDAYKAAEKARHNTLRILKRLNGADTDSRNDDDADAGGTAA